VVKDRYYDFKSFKVNNEYKLIEMVRDDNELIRVGYLDIRAITVYDNRVVVEYKKTNRALIKDVNIRKVIRMLDDAKLSYINKT
jgi:hypothetical protein